MPKIPTKDSLGSAPSLRSGRKVIQASEVDTSARYKGLADLGKAISGLGGQLQAQQEKADNENKALDLLRAEAAFERASTDIELGLDGDTDYSTHGSKYAEQSGTAADLISGNIRDPNAREKWRLKTEVGIERGRNTVTKRANTLDRQKRFGELEDTLLQNQHLYSSPDATREQRTRAMEGIGTAISLAERAGIATPGQARALRLKYQNGAETADIERRIIEDPEGLVRDLTGNRGLPQEAPGLLTPGTIDIGARPEIYSDDGTVSTYKSISITENGREVLIPMIAPDGTDLNKKQAIERYRETGEHLGIFENREQANLYAKRVSEQPRKASNDKVKALISTRLETGETDPLKGVSQIVRDSGGTKSYGNFGLNTGGSAQKFAKEYGEPLGLTAQPGTAKFDKQWKSLAAADPAGLHAAEMDWYSRNVTSKISKRLSNIGAPPSIRNDPRVQAYFADRSIQQGNGSIEMRKHAARIRQAMEGNETNPVQFLRDLTELDRDAMFQDFPTALGLRGGPVVYSQRGHDNRIDGRLQMSLSIGGREHYGTVSPRDRAVYIERARKAVRSNAESMRSQYKQMLADDIESIRKTGVGADNFDLEGAKGVLNNSQISNWEVERSKAAMEFEALNDLETLSDNELHQRLKQLEPKPGEAGFDIKSGVYEKTEKRVNQLVRMRQEDPAKSVDELPEVRQARQAVVENPANPQSIQGMIRARLDAQEKVGIPDNLQSPITKQEARTIASRVKGLEGTALREAMIPLQQELEQIYGPYARAVGVAAIETITRDRELAETVTGILNRTFRGLEPSAAQLRESEIFNEGAMSMRSLGGEFVGSPFSQFTIPGQTPPDTQAPAQTNPFAHYGMGGFPQRAIALLKTNPGLAPMFEAKYGPGSAAVALSQPDLQ